MTQQGVPGVLPELGNLNADLDQEVLFDVRVMAWRSTGPGTIAALQEVFGLDVDTATQLVSQVPASVKRGVSAQDAQEFMAALTSVGAQVVLARAGTSNTLDVTRIPALQGSAVPSMRAPAPTPAPLPRPPTAAPMQRSLPARPSQLIVSPPPSPSYALSDQMRLQSVPAPPPRSAPGAARATSATLGGPGAAPQRASTVVKPPPPKQTASAPVELDLLGNDGHSTAARSGGAKVRAASGRLDSGPMFTDGDDAPRLRRHAGQRELDLEATSSEPQHLDLTRSAPGARLPEPQMLSAPARLELDEPALAAPPQRAARSISDGAHAPRSASDGARAQTEARRRSPAVIAPAAAAAASKVPGRPSRLVALRQILIALTVVAIGLWVDDSILRGDATPLGVLLHGFGIYQLGLGVRGLVTS